MRNEEEIQNRFDMIRSYYRAGWFQEERDAFFAASEVLWVLGFEEGAGEEALKTGQAFHDGRETREHV